MHFNRQADRLDYGWLAAPAASTLTDWDSTDHKQKSLTVGFLLRAGTILPLLLSGSHRLHRNSISVGCARNFGLLPSQLVEFVQRGFVRGIEGINLVADHQSVLSAFLHADTNAGCGRNPTLRVFSTAHGIANLSGKGLGAVRSHAWHNSQSRAQHHRRYPNLQHPQTRHKSSSCFPLLRLGRGLSPVVPRRVKHSAEHTPHSVQYCTL